MTRTLELKEINDNIMQPSNFATDQRLRGLPNLIGWLVEPGLESMPPLQLPFFLWTAETEARARGALYAGG